MGRSRTTRAGRALTEKQNRFVRLIAQGVSNREACRIVGVNRRTGTRWRLGRTIRNSAGEAVHYPPVHILTPPKRHPRYLSLDERMVIADLRRERRSVREIAGELGRSPATVSRELRRNVDDRGRYLPRSADRADRSDPYCCANRQNPPTGLRTIGGLRCPSPRSRAVPVSRDTSAGMVCTADRPQGRRKCVKKK
jgi:Helix-turn-helix domain/Homeodomain-like domain